MHTSSYTVLTVHVLNSYSSFSHIAAVSKFLIEGGAGVRSKLPQFSSSLTANVETSY